MKHLIFLQNSFPLGHLFSRMNPFIIKEHEGVGLTSCMQLLVALCVHECNCAWHYACMNAIVHDIMRAWMQLCMTLCVHECNCAWHCACMNAIVRDIMRAWMQLCVTLCVHECNCAWHYACMNAIVHDIVRAWMQLLVTLCVHECNCAWHYACTNAIVHDIMHACMQAQIGLSNSVVSSFQAAKAWKNRHASKTMSTSLRGACFLKLESFPELSRITSSVRHFECCQNCGWCYCLKLEFLFFCWGGRGGRAKGGGKRKGREGGREGGGREGWLKI